MTFPTQLETAAQISCQFARLNEKKLQQPGFISDKIVARWILAWFGRTEQFRNEG